MALDPVIAVQTSLGINKTATKLAIGGFVVMALTIGLMQMQDDDTLTFWQLLAGLVALIVLMMILSQLPLLARRLLGWVTALCFAFVAITATGQAITQNGCPRLASATCILSFHLAPSCAVSRPRVEADIGPETGFGAVSAGTLGPEVLVLVGGQNAAAASLPGQIDARVFIQFAGFPRDQVVGLADALGAQGWWVEGGDRGGERIEVAAGLNEVRYFNPSDAGLAQALAAAAGTTLGRGPLTVNDLSASGYGRTETGLLELWVSQ